MPLRKIDRLFTYTYSTAPRPSFSGSRAAPLVSFLLGDGRVCDTLSLIMPCGVIKIGCGLHTCADRVSVLKGQFTLNSIIHVCFPLTLVV